MILLLLQYAVASGNIAAVNKALLRLELHVSKSPIKVDEAGLGRVLSENQIQTTIAEFTKEELDTLIGAMDAIELVRLLPLSIYFEISCDECKFPMRISMMHFLGVLVLSYGMTRLDVTYLNVVFLRLTDII